MLSIAPFKSIVAPDVDGDRAYNILTHSTRVGVARIANEFAHDYERVLPHPNGHLRRSNVLQLMPMPSFRAFIRK